MMTTFVKKIALQKLELLGAFKKTIFVLIVDLIDDGALFFVFLHIHSWCVHLLQHSHNSIVIKLYFGNTPVIASYGNRPKNQRGIHSRFGGKPHLVDLHTLTK